MGQKKLVRKAEPPSNRRIAWPRWTVFRGMTLRDWLQLLIVPLALVGIGFLFTMQQDARQQQIEEQRAQDAALQSYFDQMSTLLMNHDLRSSDEGSEVRNLARTLTALARLDPTRKTALIRFLGDAALIQSTSIESDNVILALSGADLSGAPLSGADLSYANLSNAEGVTNQQLERETSSLFQATMPNGQKYEDWLKSREEDGER